MSALFGLRMEDIARNDALVREMLRAIVRPFDEQAVAAGNRAYAALSDTLLAGLLRYPDVLARVRDNPELLPSAIEESWRWCGSSMGTVRFVEREVTIGGETFAPGSVLQMGWLATHFDPEIYEQPERFDIDRKVKTMIFGGGPHYCVGAPLARMETRVAVSQLLARFPELRADPGRKPPSFAAGTRGSIAFGPDHLAVVLD